jgi:hypothetical protein
MFYVAKCCRRSRRRHAQNGLCRPCAVYTRRSPPRNATDAPLRAPIPPADWAEFRSTLERTGFWSMPESYDRIGLDGSTWSIRGRCGEREHSSTCWSPTEGPFHELGSLFVKLAGVDLIYDPP